MSHTAYLAAQLATHPTMEAQDLYKLCYQAAFGAEHLLTDPARALTYFKEEYAPLTPCEGELAEPISDTLCRVDLSAYKSLGLPEEWLFSLFCATASAPSRGADLVSLLSETESYLRREGREALADAFSAFCAARLAEPLCPVHHSQTYCKVEAPHYRLVSRAYLRALPILRAYARLPERQAPTVIAIDGRCASGKTTLAEILSRVLGASVIHMDDFFLPPSLRTEDRLAEAGGNVHYERFALEVLPRLSLSAPFSYRVFDCGQMDYAGERAVDASPVRIVEGSYALHPAFGDYAHLAVFSHVEADEQMRRILIRNGEEMAERFRTRWIPMEERYFAACSVSARADLCLS